MERNFVTLHASVHPVHDVIMTGVIPPLPPKKAAQVSAASTDTEGFEPPWAFTQTVFKTAAL